MKKCYQSPEILFEDFTLSVNIALNCDIIIDTQSYNTCALGFGRNAIFVESVNACTTKIEDGSQYNEYDQVCYHVPSQSTDLFNS